MASKTKKTYSRADNSHLFPEKENIDPFDELLSSPLKRDVEFKPLSFWNEKTKSYKSKKNSSEVKFGLFESDSEDLNSPFQKKRKVKSRSLKVRNHQKTKTQSLGEGVKIDSSKASCLSNNDTSKDETRMSLSSNPDDSKNFSDRYVTVRRNFKWPVFCDKIVHQSYAVNETIRDLPNFNIGETYIISQNDSHSSTQELLGDDLQNTIQIESSVDSSHCFLESLLGGNVWESQTNVQHCKADCEDTGIFDEIVVQSGEDTLEVEYFQKSFDKNNDSEWKDSMFSSFDGDRSDIQNGTALKIFKSESPECGSSDCDSSLFQSALSFNSPIEEPEKEKTSVVGDLAQKTIRDLTTRMSDITISKVELYSPEPNKSETVTDDKCYLELKDEPTVTKLTPEESLKRNITTRRRVYNVPQKLEISSDLSSSAHKPKKRLKADFNNTLLTKEPLQFSPIPLEFKNRISAAPERFSSFTVPVFESTRVMNDSLSDVEDTKNLSSEVTVKNMEGSLETSFGLKSGKKWVRSRSVLRQLQNGINLENSNVKGKKYKSFVQEVFDMQNDDFRVKIPNATAVNNTCKTVFDYSTKNKNASKHPYNPIEDERFSTGFALNNESRFLSVMLNKSSMNHTVKVIQPENSLEKPSDFRRALGLEADNVIESVIDTEEESSTISPKDFILAQCGQDDVLPFEEYFNERTLKNCKKIGEGVYGEVFMCNSDTVIKIIPIEGSDLVNGEPQKKFGEILSEVVIAAKLSNLRRGEKYQTSGFSELKKCWCVVGKYPQYLIDLWDEYDQSGSGSENDSPVMFKSDQLYIILELANGGKDLEAFVFSSSEQSFSVFIQTAYSLAAAEKAFEFEHRDLHWGNILIAPTKEKFVTIILDGEEHKLPTKGVKVSIIDFTLSRISHEGCCIFNDLSVDPTLFQSQGDYQFEIYRMMQKAVKDDWSSFEPKTNVFWLHYILDKMIKMVRYKNKTSQVHKKSMKKLKFLEDIILEHEDCLDFVSKQKVV